MKFEFKYVKNGAMLTINHEEGEEPEILVYSEPAYGTEENEVEAFADFLRTINDTYGPSTSRYSKARIYVKVEPGDKYEDLQEAKLPDDTF